VIAASVAVQRPRDAKLLVVSANGSIEHRARTEFVELLRAGDVVVANDAATIPASLSGYHERTGLPIEVRLAGRDSSPLNARGCYVAVVFGAGDFRIRTEDRPPPPSLKNGDLLRLGSLHATVLRVLQHPRLVEIRFDGSSQEIWKGIAQHGKPIQYSHLETALAVWDTWTPIAGPPVAFEPPSAGFALSWRLLTAMAAKGVRFATLTHAAGLSSTGDADLDALLPFDEWYSIPQATEMAFKTAHERGSRVIAVGTTVVRALEDSGGRAGEGLARQRIGPGSQLRVVDAIFSGTHEPGTSHYDLLRAFCDPFTLHTMSEELDAAGYRTHEFGDSVFVEANRLMKR
jgi:S-adenosylmethionine:tRNA ribosyltransferase-isomerase